MTLILGLEENLVAHILSVHSVRSDIQELLDTVYPDLELLDVFVEEEIYDKGGFVHLWRGIVTYVVTGEVRW